jgi:ABC-type phosphate transport system substrate-binding protein
MRKTLAILAWAAVPALLMSACNGNANGGGSGVASLPNAPAASQRGRVHHNDNGPGDLHAGGSDLPAYGYNLGDQPTGLYTAGQATPGPGSLLAYAAQQNADGNNYYYCTSSSGYGRKEFTGAQDVGAGACAALGSTATGFGGRGDPVDFVGSDPMSSTDCCASGTPYATNYASTYGQPFEFPTYGGPIVFPYINEGGNGLTGLGSSQLKLSTWTYCAIANGTIGYWDDGAITKDNGGTAVAGHQPITFYYRGDSSFVSYIFETKLNDSSKGCNQTFKGVSKKSPYAGAGRNAAWPFGVTPLTTLAWTGPTGAQPSGSTFTGETGDPGIIEAIQGLIGTGYPYATAYAEGAWAAAASSPSLGQAALLNGSSFVSPTNPNAVASALKKASPASIVYGEGGDGNPLSSSTPWCQLYIPPSVYVDPPSGAYPIVGLGYFLFYGKDQNRGGSDHFTDLKNLIVDLDSTSWNNALPNLEYSPLPAATQKKIQKALTGSHAQPACLSN